MYSLTVLDASAENAHMCMFNYSFCTFSRMTLYAVRTIAGGNLETLLGAVLGFCFGVSPTCIHNMLNFKVLSDFSCNAAGM